MSWHCWSKEQDRSGLKPERPRGRSLFALLVAGLMAFGGEANARTDDTSTITKVYTSGNGAVAFRLANEFARAVAAGAD